MLARAVFHWKVCIKCELSLLNKQKDHSHTRCPSKNVLLMSQQTRELKSVCHTLKSVLCHSLSVLVLTNEWKIWMASDCSWFVLTLSVNSKHHVHSVWCTVAVISVFGNVSLSSKVWPAHLHNKLGCLQCNLFHLGFPSWILYSLTAACLILWLHSWGFFSVHFIISFI